MTKLKQISEQYEAREEVSFIIMKWKNRRECGFLSCSQNTWEFPQDVKVLEYVYHSYGYNTRFCGNYVVHII